MTFFETLYMHVFKRFKTSKKKTANQYATLYVSFLQCAILLLLGVFFAAFFNQMHVNTFSQDKGWTLFIIACAFLFFNNWMHFAGRKHQVLNAKMISKKTQKYPLFKLVLMPVICIVMAVVFWQAV
ncbi:hypothetical protein ACW5R3_02655 [Bizionia sp. KMM 8389]